MSAGWVASGVRARAMSGRRVGAAAARQLASVPGLAEAVDELAGTPYGHVVRPGQTLAEAQHAVSATLLWHLRVLGGWVPHGDARILRVLAGGFEIANTDERLRELGGAAAEPAFQLGTLSTAWNRIALARSPAHVREALTRSVWGDPGAETAAAVHLGMRLSWAARVTAAVPDARPWAGGAAALLLAREVVLAGRRPTAEAVRVAGSLLGSTWVAATSVASLRAALPHPARWALDAVQDPTDLWRAEAAWWLRVERDGFALLRGPVTTAAPVIGMAAVLAADAWRVRAALAVAARGGALTPEALEAFDAVA